MRVLGVDPGLTRCGVGVIDGSPGRPPQLVAVGVGDGVPGTGLGAGGAEQAFTQVDVPRRTRLDRPGGTGIGAAAAAVGAGGGIDERTSAETVGERRRRTVGVGDRAVFLLQTREDGFDHGGKLTNRVRNKRG